MNLPVRFKREQNDWKHWLRDELEKKLQQEQASLPDPVEAFSLVLEHFGSKGWPNWKMENGNTCTIEHHSTLGEFQSLRNTFHHTPSLQDISPLSHSYYFFPFSIFQLQFRIKQLIIKN